MCLIYTQNMKMQKVYIKPTLNVVRIASQKMLVGSTYDIDIGDTPTDPDLSD